MSQIAQAEAQALGYFPWAVFLDGLLSFPSPASVGVCV